MTNNVFLLVACTATVKYRDLGEGRRISVPKVEKWRAELSKDQSATILRYKGEVINVRCHSGRFLNWEEKQRFLRHLGLGMVASNFDVRGEA